jgi:hypothetical protein
MYIYNPRGHPTDSVVLNVQLSPENRPTTRCALHDHYLKELSPPPHRALAICHVPKDRSFLFFCPPVRFRRDRFHPEGTAKVERFFVSAKFILK